MKIQASVKHLQIAQANNLMFAVVALASVLIVFSLISAKTLMGVSSYQHKALRAKHEAIKKLQSNIEAADSLKKQYDTFEKQNPNVLGGVGGLDVAEAISQQGEAAGSIDVKGKTISLSGQDGDNAKIILDALPSSYDFPALISSMEKIANQDHIPLQGVGGSDQAVQTPLGDAPTQSQPVAIPISLSAQTDYNTVKILINDMERSIRPMDLSTITFSGNGSSMQVSFQLNTYYQAPVSLQITQKDVPK
jgi:hypothetical protein